MTPHLSWRDTLLALAVVLVWGTNFVVIKWGLATWPPLLFVALRYALSSLPLLVLARPRVSWGLIAGYGKLPGFGDERKILAGTRRHATALTEIDFCAGFRFGVDGPPPYVMCTYSATICWNSSAMRSPLSVTVF